MKREHVFFRRSMTTVVILIFACGFFKPLLNAQLVLPDLRVNSQIYTEVSLDGGGKQLAVLNDTVYAVFQGKPTTSISNMYFSKSVNSGTTFQPEKNIYEGPVVAYHAYPSIAVAQNGTIHIAWVAVTGGSGSEMYNVWYTKSVNGGASFETPVVITTNNASVNPAIDVHGNNVFIIYASAVGYPAVDYYFVRSVNNGVSFSSAIQINDAPCLGTIEFDEVCTIEVDASGNVYLAWVDGRRPSGNGDIFFAKSTDQGASFSSNVMVNDITQAGADAVQYIPSLAVDAAGIIYVSFTDRRIGGTSWENNRAYITKSTDGGATFATETLLAGHNDICKHKDIAVSPAGKLHAALVTNVDPLSWGVWLYESSDGGATFTSPVKLNNSTEFDFSEVRVVAPADNKLYSLWQEVRSGENNIFFAKAMEDVGTALQGRKTTSGLHVYQSSTGSPLNIQLPGSDNPGEVTIYNLTGSVVYRITAIKTTTLTVQSNLPVGVYLLSYTSDAGIETRKFIKK